MIRRTFTHRRFQIIAALSVGLFLTVASALPGPLEAQTTGTATLTVRDTFTKNGTTKMGHTYSVKEKDGSWRKIEEDDCTRAK